MLFNTARFMRNRPFELPLPQSDLMPASVDREIPGKKFSGKTLFRNNLYHLETGNLSVLDSLRNGWFLEELFNYSRENYDQNLIPAIRRIADSTRYSESMRQKASEAIEIIEEHTAGNGPDKISLARSEKEKSATARRMLAAIRYPQTTDILRLLREKSPELKRLALFLIGKFNMTDMIQEVCECLNYPETENDAFSVLVSFGSKAGNDLNRFYLISSGNLNISRAILRIYAKSCPENKMSFLVERLWSNSRQLKEIALNALIRCEYSVEKEESERLKKSIFETFNLLTRLASGKVCLSEQGDILLYSEIDREYRRWKDYLLRLLILTYGKVISVSARENHFEKEGIREKYLPELASIIYGSPVTTKPDNISGTTAERKLLKRLHRFFPGDIPKYNRLLDDVINCDYNILSIWTRACTLRNLTAIDDDEMAESVVALLFSPEELLREEAAALISRSRKELFDTVSGRIYGPIRKRLEEIINGHVVLNELLYEKVVFLSSCFPGIPEDVLLYLAEKIVYIKGDDTKGLHSGAGAILWSFSEKAGLTGVQVMLETSESAGTMKEKAKNVSFYYRLPLNIVEQFGFRYPESFPQILRYIDDKEV